MTTIVFVHAHPDDEASATAGSMALATDRGDRVVVVYATNGDHGERPDDLADGETLVDRRRAEAMGSAAALGTAAVHWLDHSDSGMSGWEQNGDPHSFCNVPVEQAAGEIAEILRAEQADVVVGYDWHGGYGHPDHVHVHRVTKRAAELAGTPRYLESTMNRDHMRRLFEAAKANGMAGPGDGDWDPDAPMDDGNPLGTPEAEIHWQLDVREVIARKRAALQAHASQTSDVGMMLAIPEDAFAMGFGLEHYVEPALGAPDGLRTTWPF